MATYQELAQALKNAHNAGDTAAARKLAQALKGMQSQMQAQQQQQPTQSALGQSVDQLQKLGGRAIQTIGAATGLQGVEDYGAKVVADQERQIAEGGYVSPVGDMTFMESLNQGRMGDWFAARIPENAATIAATPVTAIGAGIATIMGAPVTATVLGGASLLTGLGLGIGGTADLGAEKGIDITDPNIARSNVAIGSVVGLLDRIGAGSIVGSVVPKEKLATMSTAEIAQIIAKKDKSKALQFLKNIFRGAAGEAATEGAQGATQIAGVAAQGGQFTSDEVLNQIVDEMAIGGSIGGGLTATADVAKGVASTVSRQPKLPEDAEAAASFAQDIEQNAATNNLKLNDLDKTSTKGARQVIDNLHQRYDEEMKMNRDILKKQLKIEDNDPLLVRIDKTLAKLAYREARNKTKSLVNKEELDAVDRLVGNTKEGRELMNLMRKMNELTRLHNSGYQGGLSRITDQFAPFGSNIGYDRTAVNTERLLRPIGSGLAALQTGGLSIAGQLGAQGIGRAVDAVRGGRSTVGSYVTDNKNRQGLTGIDKPSVLEDSLAAQERAELEKQLQAEGDALEQQLKQQEELSRRRAAYINQDLPAAGSPEATMVIATEGVDQKSLEQIVDYIGQTREELKEAADAYLAGVRGQSLNEVPGLTELIRAVKTFVDNTPQFANKKNPQLAARISENFTTPVAAAAAGVPGYMNTPNYQRGIADNQAAADSLTEAVNNDANISAPDKAKLLDGLAQLRSNLGTNPAGKAVDIYNNTKDNLTDKALADQYLLPYVERVAGQQPNNQEGTMENMAAPSLEIYNDPMRISPRRPTAVSAVEDPLADSLQITGDDITRAPLGEKLLPKLMQLPGIAGSRKPGDNRSDQRVYTDFIKDNLLWLYNSVSPEYRERAKQWYVGANRLSQQAADKYNLALSQVAGVMASLSPQKDWYMNYDLGIRTIDAYNTIQPTDVFDKKMATAFRRMIKKQSAKSQKFLKKDLQNLNGKQWQDTNTHEKAIFIRFWDEINNPERGHRVISPEGDLLDFQMTNKGVKSGTAWNGFRDIEKAVSIIENGARENIDLQLGFMHKVRSFYNNILSPMSDMGDVTIDTHAVAAGQLRPLSGEHQEVKDNFKGGGNSQVTGAVGSYGFNGDAYREAAAEVGILPREMQSITWEAVRGLFTPSFKADPKNQEKITNIWKKYDNGDINIDQARQEILDAAGGINRAAWEGQRPNNTEVDTVGVLSNSRGLSSPSVPGTEDGRRAGSEPTRPLLRATEDGERGTFEAIELPERGLSFTGSTATIPLVGSKVAEPAEIRDQLTATEVLFQEGKPIEIGVPGTPFENGIQDTRVAKAIANALGYSLEIFTNQAQMKKDAKNRFKASTDSIGALYASKDPEKDVYDYVNKRFVRGKIFALGEYKSKKGNKDTTLPQSVYVALHELGHAIERLPMGGDTSPMMRLMRSPSGRLIETDDRIRKNTFRGYLARIIDAFSGEPPNVQNEVDRGEFPLDQTEAELGTIVEEAIKLQMQGVLNIPGAGQLNMLRPDYGGAAQAYMEAGAEGDTERQRRIKNQINEIERGYFHTPQELAADLISAYMIDPKAFKRQAPTAAKFIRDLLNSANAESSKFVKFYSAPLAMVVATIMAQLMLGEQEEEDKKGALSLGQGALSA